MDRRVDQTERVVRIETRFRGPDRSGNGGYSAGLVGSALDGPVQVTLRQPPPLELDLTLAVSDGRATLTGPSGLVAEAVTVSSGELADAVVEAVPEHAARAAEPAYQGLTDSPFPSCFTCGRDNAQGLRLRPGVIAEGRTACTWTPGADLAGSDGLVEPEYVWAALDCPGGWSADIAGRPMVLGRLTAHVTELPRPGETYVVTGGYLGAEGRKTYTATSLYAGNRLLARARHTWIEIDPADFN